MSVKILDEGAGAPRRIVGALRSGERVELLARSLTFRSQAHFLHRMDGLGVRILSAAHRDVLEPDESKQTALATELVSCGEAFCEYVSHLRVRRKGMGEKGEEWTAEYDGTPTGEAFAELLAREATNLPVLVDMVARWAGESGALRELGES